MKKALSMVLLTLMFLTGLAGCSSKQEVFTSTPEEIAATSAYMYNFNSDTPVYEKDSGKSMRPGSLVHIMTAMVAMDNSLNNFDKEVVVTEYSFNNDVKGKALPNANIHEGEKYTVDELLNAMLVGNSYDAANILAYHFGGDDGGNREAFIEMMNAKAKEIGMDSTVFANPHGGYDERQVTTAYDMFKMARYFIEKYPTLYSKANMNGYDIEARSGQSAILLRSENLLTVSNLNSEFFDERAKNIKYSSYKGMDEPYEHLITYVEDATGMQYLVVVMRSPYLGMPPQSTRIRNPDDSGVSGATTESNMSQSSTSSTDTSQSSGDTSSVFPSSSSPEPESQSTSSESGTSSKNNSSSDSSSNQSSVQQLTIKDKTPYSFVDTKLLIDWAFNTFRIAQQTEQSNVLLKLDLLGFEKKSIEVGLSKKPKDFLPSGEKGENISYLCQTYPYIENEIKKGDIVGSAAVLGIDSGEESIPNINLIAMEDYKDSTFGLAILRFLLTVIILIILMFILMIVIRMRNLKKRKERRRRKREQMRASQSGRGNRTTRKI